MTPAKVARILARCDRVERARRASRRAGELGLGWLADGLWCHAMALWARGYPESAALYRQQRNQHLGAP
ncbi:MAG: hypothetical protein JW751_08620 [Polyangiaceae bacterium]|nr:hypothetical protein [Polyangiaceae bacterium]